MKDKDWLKVLSEKFIFSELLFVLSHALQSFENYLEDYVIRKQLTQREGELQRTGSHTIIQSQIYFLLEHREVFDKRGLVDKGLVEEIFDVVACQYSKEKSEMIGMDRQNLMKDGIEFAEILEALCEVIVSGYYWSKDKLNNGELSEKEVEMLGSGSRVFMEFQIYSLLKKKRIFLKKGTVDKDIINTIYERLVQRALSDVEEGNK